MANQPEYLDIALIDKAKIFKYRTNPDRNGAYQTWEEFAAYENADGKVHMYAKFNSFLRIAIDVPEGFIKNTFKGSYIKESIFDPSKVRAVKCIPDEAVGTHYGIYFEGNNEFIAYDDGKAVRVYKPDPNAYIDEEDWDCDDVENNRGFYICLVGTFAYDKIFIGKSYEKRSANRYIGNTLLLQLNDKYTYIGVEIYSFYADQITEYYSNVLCDAAAYPLAVSAEYVYFLTCKRKVRKTAFNIDYNKKSKVADLHGQFFNHISDDEKIQFDVEYIHEHSLD